MSIDEIIIFDDKVAIMISASHTQGWLTCGQPLPLPLNTESHYALEGESGICIVASGWVYN